MPTKLQDILIGEVSAVDDPANQLPGWTLMKSRDDVLKTVDAMLGIGRINDALAEKGDTMKADELQALAANLLELFAVLSPGEKQELLAALDPGVSKAMLDAAQAAGVIKRQPAAPASRFQPA
jgi:hypothetical protein